MSDLQRAKSLVQLLDDRTRIRARAWLHLYRKYSSEFRLFAERVTRDFKWYRHVEELCKVLDRVASGEIKRLMVFMPPRHGKSETVSRLFSAYWLYRFPYDHVGLTSYAADLAHGLSRASMSYYAESGRRLHPDVSAAREWQTLEGGTMWSAGVGGPITGKGFHLGIIDDPIKNVEDAESLKTREDQIEWYKSVWSTRREPGAAEIIIQTRWHVEDLSGWLLSQPDASWYILNFEAIKSDDRQTYGNCTLHPDWRELGDALCPERYNVETLRQIQSDVGSRYWAALYQQRPTIDTGSIWQREYFKPFQLGTEPVLYDIGCDWDLAYTKEDRNSASAFIKSGRDRDGNIYILDIGWRYVEFPELMLWMKSFKDTPHFIEAKASGKSAKQSLMRDLIFAEEVPVRGGDKIARTRLVTPPAEQGKLWVASHLKDKLLDDQRQGVLKVGGGFESDLNDALVQAINRHVKTKIRVSIY